jgi:TRAP-type C4-dicarboxylate transport system permease large subunit
MLYGGIADRIVAFAKSLVGHIRGGLGMSNVVACTLFGGVSGSPVADVSAMGAVMIPMMKREGYHADYAVNVTTHASLVGALMPTSHNMIIYSLAAGGKVSIAALILAGLLPALILTICNLVAAYLVAIKRGYPSGTFSGWDIVLRSFAAALPGLFVVVIIVVGILSGVFTATESASVAVLWALAMTVLVYRSLSWEHFLEAAAHAVKKTGVVLLLIGVSATFGYLISLYSSRRWERPRGDHDDPVCLPAGRIILFLEHLDMAATILSPVRPSAALWDGPCPVRHADAINFALGLNTFGGHWFVGCAIGEVSIGHVMRTIWPFYGALIAALMIVTYVPAFSLWLPQLAGYIPR